jgi:hypothetical protein
MLEGPGRRRSPASPFDKLRARSFPEMPEFTGSDPTARPALKLSLPNHEGLAANGEEQK